MRASLLPVMLVASLVGGLVAPSAVSAETAAPAAGTTTLIVKLRAGLTPEQQAAAIERNGGIESRVVAPLRLHMVDVATELAEPTLASYQADTEFVERAQFDMVRAAEGTPSDPAYSTQWALPKIGWESVYGAVTPAGNATIAVLDTGVDASAPERLSSSLLK